MSDGGVWWRRRIDRDDATAVERSAAARA